MIEEIKKAGGDPQDWKDSSAHGLLFNLRHPTSILSYARYIPSILEHSLENFRMVCRDRVIPISWDDGKLEEHQVIYKNGDWGDINLAKYDSNAYNEFCEVISIVVNELIKEPSYFDNLLKQEKKYIEQDKEQEKKEQEKKYKE